MYQERISRVLAAMERMGLEQMLCLLYTSDAADE